MKEQKLSSLPRRHGPTWAALDDDVFWGGNAQVEIMRLATGRWREFDAAEREAFEARIRGGLPRDLFPPEAFQKEEDWISVRDAAAMKRLTRLRRRQEPQPITLEETDLPSPRSRADTRNGRPVPMIETTSRYGMRVVGDSMGSPNF